MSRPSFPGEHICERCSRWVHEHECILGDDHFISPCCPEFPCGSFEVIHPEYEE